MLWQVACEFVAASRKLAPFGFTADQAWREIKKVRGLWTTKLPDWRVADRAEQLMHDGSVSFWDAMIVAACIEAGVTRLYSENFDNSVASSQLTVINPFKDSAEHST